MVPGTYIAKRRVAAGLSVDEVAEKLRTEPPLSALDRADLIRSIEAGSPARFPTIVALRRIFPFDLDVLEHLAARDLGLSDYLPRICRGCGCSQMDPCRIGEGPCGWTDVAARPVDTRCTACSPELRKDAA